MKKFLIHVIFPIIIGGLIYILFREKNLLMFEWFTFLRLDFIVNFLRENLYKYRNYIPKSLLFSLPDALWVYSFTMFLSFYYENKLLLSIIFVGSLIVEILQLWFVIGTFDFYDVLYMFILFLVALYVINKKTNERRVR